MKARQGYLELETLCLATLLMMQWLERSLTTTILHQQCSCPNLTLKSSHTAVVKALKTTTEQRHNMMKIKMIHRSLLRWWTLPNLKLKCLQTLRLSTMKLRNRTQKKKKNLRKDLHRVQMRLRQDLLCPSLRLGAHKEATNSSTSCSSKRVLSSVEVKM